MRDTNGQLGKAYLKDYIVRATPLLKEFLEKEKTEAINDKLGDIPLKLIETYSQLVSEGKGIRGALIELAYKACGGTDLERVLHASIFIELFHTAILIHDDFMDRDPFRRGIPAVHKTFEGIGKSLKVKIPADHYGNAVAVCIGDTGFYYSWKVLLDSGFAPAVILDAGKIYADYISRLGLGQALDLSITGAAKVSEEEALKVLLLKSAEYTAILPMKIGAALAGEEDIKRITAIENYAKCFGWAFQIQDDILGLFAKEEELGKPVGSDLREGKNTLLMIRLRKLGNQAQLEFQQKVLGNQDATVADVERMKNILKDSGTYQHVLDLGWKYTQEGTSYIPQVTSDKKIQEILESTIYYMMERTK